MTDTTNTVDNASVGGEDQNKQDQTQFIPKSRFDEVNIKRKEAEARAKQLEEQLQSQNSDQVIETNWDDYTEASRFVEKKAQEVFEKKLQEFERSKQDKEFLNNLDKLGYPKVDEDDLKEFAQSNGIRSLKDAYKIMNHETIVDIEKKKLLKENHWSIKSVEGARVSEADISAKIKSAKTKQELEKILKETWIAK